MHRDEERDELASRYGAVRAASERLAEPLSAEDCGLQSMPDASPTKWHLAHTSWYFETFVLETAAPGYRAFDPAFRVLFNSYYNGIGAQYARPQRGLLSRPTLEEVFAYRAHVDRHLAALLAKGADLAAPVREVIEVGLHHEQQHQELILTDLKHGFSQNPLQPVYRAGAAVVPPSGPAGGGGVPGAGWQRHAGGLLEIGAPPQGFAFDNERPRHRVFVEAFELATRPVTNGDWIAFIEAGGYERPEHWLADGWTTARARGWSAPLYWRPGEGGRFETFTLGGVRDVDPEEPVCHVSHYEADAYARFAGARLPTEVEWEVAAQEAPVQGNFIESGRLHPRRCAAQAGLQALYGDVWEWTASPYVAYPGFRPPAGALGEYNGKFMSGQWVLRGGSCTSPRSHLRASYRNFFYPDARWQFSGLRLARDA